VVCVDDNADPHVNNGRGKKFGYIFTTSGGIEPGWNRSRVVSLGHWASLVVSLEIRHNIYHYCTMPSPALVHSHPRPGHHPPPLCACRGTAVCHCEHAEQTRGIWIGLYVDRRIVGTQSVHGCTQASASLKKNTSS